MPNKYGNKPTTLDGIRFDSKKEAARYAELKLLEQAGAITKLELQPAFALRVNGHDCGKYVGDFSYREGGRMVVEDVKGGNATKTPLYKLKRKLMFALYGITIAEI